MCFMKLYFPFILSWISWIMFTFLLFDEVKKGEKGMCLLKISGYAEVMDCTRKGGDIFFHGWTKFSRDFVIIKKGEIVEVSSALTPWPGCFDDYKVQRQKEERN